MGWIMLGLIGAAVAGALFALGLPRLVWTSVGAALMLAAAGYVLQGKPNMPETRAVPQVDTIEVQPDEIEMRDEMFGHYHNGMPYLAAADAMLRAGDARSAAAAVLGGIKGNPGNSALWTALGSTLTASDGGMVSPSALFAFRQAMRLVPGHPGPHYFLGLAYAGAGQLQPAQAEWKLAYRLSSANAAYRAKIGDRLQMLDQFMAMRGGQAPPPR
jgi:cytochrome c-type biogenesis protein CcmH